MHIDLEETEVIAISESNAINIAMTNRGIGGITYCEVLYDASNEPSFLLGVSEKGYLIMARDTQQVIESGEGNPYAEYEGVKKYYGGALCYYVPINGQFFDICR